jgi:ElaB protein
MNMKVEQTGTSSNGGALHRAPNGKRGRLKRAGASEEMRNLIADVEELVSRLMDAADPEITRLRTQITKTIATAKASLTDGVSEWRDRAVTATRVADDYVRDRRWQVIGATALAAAALGALATRRRTR